MSPTRGYVYIATWSSACVIAIALSLQRPSALTLFGRPYWRWLLQPWKLATFAVAAAGMVLVGPFTGDPTWDRVDGGVQSVLTFATAPWAVGVIYRALKKIGPTRPREVYAAACTWLFSASWVYDAWLLIRDGHYVKEWALNLGASSGLYMMGGVFWSLSHRPGERTSVAFTRVDWPSGASSRQRGVVGAALAIGAVVAILMAPLLWTALETLLRR